MSNTHNETQTDPREAEFELWWQREGQFCRAGGGDYEKSFAWAAFVTGKDSALAGMPTPTRLTSLLVSYGGAMWRGNTTAAERFRRSFDSAIAPLKKLKEGV